MIENRRVCQNSLWVNRFSLSYVDVDLSLNGPVPPIATDEAIGLEQINGAVPVNKDDTMQVSPTVPSTSVEGKKTPTILKRLQPKNEQTQSHASRDE
jgi:hypothetical protein